MRITAKFETVCPECQTPIARGTRVEWERGKPAVHAECADAKAPVQRCADCEQAIGPKAAAWDVTRVGEARRVVCTRCKNVRAQLRQARTVARFPGWTAEKGWSAERTAEELAHRKAGRAADGRTWDEVEMDALNAIRERESEEAGFRSDPDFRRYEAQERRGRSPYREALAQGDPELARAALRGELD